MLPLSSSESSDCALATTTGCGHSPLDRPHPDGWLVSGEWTQPVVVAGAQSLLSEELKGSIQMKD